MDRKTKTVCGAVEKNLKDRRQFVEDQRRNMELRTCMVLIMLMTGEAG